MLRYSSNQIKVEDEYLVRIWNQVLQCFHFLINPTPPSLPQTKPINKKSMKKTTKQTSKSNQINKCCPVIIDLKQNHKTKILTFSDKLWTSAALLLFDELRDGAGFGGTSSTNASRPSCL